MLCTLTQALEPGERALDLCDRRIGEVVHLEPHLQRRDERLLKIIVKSVERAKVRLLGDAPVAVERSLEPICVVAEGRLDVRDEVEAEVVDAEDVQRLGEDELDRRAHARVTVGDESLRRDLEDLAECIKGPHKRLRVLAKEDCGRQDAGLALLANGGEAAQRDVVHRHFRRRIEDERILLIACCVVVESALLRRGMRAVECGQKEGGKTSVQRRA